MWYLHDGKRKGLLLLCRNKSEICNFPQNFTQPNSNLHTILYVELGVIAICLLIHKL